VTDRGFAYDSDILEALTRVVAQAIPGNLGKRIWFGTVGTGLDVARLVWTQGIHVFSSQTSDLQKVLPDVKKRIAKLVYS
jgi:hypothetical protein